MNTPVIEVPIGSSAIPTPVAPAEIKKNFNIGVLYDGITKPVHVKIDELVKMVLEQAIHIFGPLPNPHTLALFTKGGDELDDAQTVHEAGITPDESLLLRPSKVKGG